MLSPSTHGGGLGLHGQFGGPSGLLQRQIESIRQMLNFNESSSVGGQSLGGVEPQWKVLIYDQVTSNFLSILQIFLKFKF